MRIPLLTIALFLAALTSCRAQFTILTLRGAGDDALPVIPAFRLTDVIDYRNDTLTIGLIKPGGALNKVEMANLEGGCAGTLKRYIQQILPQADGKPMVAMVIKDLRISEEMRFMRETARLHVTYEFYRLDGKNFPLVFTFSRDFEWRGFDVTLRHEANIRRSVREALEEFAAASAKGVVTARR